MRRQNKLTIRQHFFAWLCCGVLHAHAATESQLILQTSPLAGFQHYAGATLFPLMQIGDSLNLRREPGNPYDPQAVRVEWRGVQIGYAPRAENVDLARLMDRGTPVEGRILHLQKSRDPWKRILMELYVVQTEEPENTPSPVKSSASPRRLQP